MQLYLKHNVCNYKNSLPLLFWNVAYCDEYGESEECYYVTDSGTLTVEGELYTPHECDL